jgi:hypothetical protein
VWMPWNCLCRLFRILLAVGDPEHTRWSEVLYDESGWVRVMKRSILTLIVLELGTSSCELTLSGNACHGTLICSRTFPFLSTLRSEI